MGKASGMNFAWEQYAPKNGVLNEKFKSNKDTGIYYRLARMYHAFGHVLYAAPFPCFLRYASGVRRKTFDTPDNMDERNLHYGRETDVVVREQEYLALQIGKGDNAVVIPENARLENMLSRAGYAMRARDVFPLLKNNGHPLLLSAITGLFSEIPQNERNSLDMRMTILLKDIFDARITHDPDPFFGKH